MSTTLPDSRLLSAASLVRQGAVFADIGTDHAYLPLFLLERGQVRRAICADIAAGPLASAKAHASASAVWDKMIFVQTDGLNGIDAYQPTDIAICGMGGELIADIIARALFVKDASVRLILQPMTRQEHLRSFLYAEGFSVIEERYSTSEGKFYLTLAAQYTGEQRTITPEQALLGVCPPPVDAAFRGYLLRKRQALIRAAEGKTKGGESTASEQAAISAIEHILTTNIDNL